MLDDAHAAGLMLGMPAAALAGAQRAGRLLREFLGHWARALLRPPIRFHLSADDHQILPPLAAMAPPGIRVRCLRNRVRLEGQRMKILRLYVEVSGRADLLTVRRWLRDGLRHYDGQVRIDGVPVDRRLRRLRDA